jgi:hypothetical protein
MARSEFHQVARRKLTKPLALDVGGDGCTVLVYPYHDGEGVMIEVMPGEGGTNAYNLDLKTTASFFTLRTFKRNP